MAKFKVGDKVKVVNYGSLMWINLNHEQPEGLLKEPRLQEKDGIAWIDMLTEIVGKEGVISQAENTQGRPRYVIHGIPMKCAWYDENQLELISS